MKRYGEGVPTPSGMIESVEFELDGQKFFALNGGPHLKFSAATSWFVSCDTQAEIDHYWEKLSVGGAVQRCGWLTDKFGMTWQIVPSILQDLLSDFDKIKSQRVMQAMLKRIKLDVQILQKAYAQ